ncbi:MAG TPA: LrgB family protein [Clostridia bacterium]|jgi:predicted murein hydrolase (TIGR00659 family)|nr:LrgB family protein [Clostridia bacterium]
MSDLVQLPLFGIVLTLTTYLIGLKIAQKIKSPLANPLLISTILVIAFLLVTGIDYQDYNRGGQIISFFLGPATVALGIPLYKQLETIKKNKIPILLGTLLGSLIAIFSVIGLAYLLGASRETIVSLSPKSVTTPIAMEVSQQIGGVVPLTIVGVVITGIIGAIIGPEVLKLVKVKSKIAKGLAIGVASHALGTSRAIEEGETEGALSSTAIGLAGIITALVLPFILKYFFVLI